MRTLTRKASCCEVVCLCRLNAVPSMDGKDRTTKTLIQTQREKRQINLSNERRKADFTYPGPMQCPEPRQQQYWCESIGVCKGIAARMRMGMINEGAPGGRKCVADDIGVESAVGS